MKSQNEDQCTGCRIVNKLQEIHDWTHACFKALRENPEQLNQAHQLGCQILSFLDDMPEPNGVKFLALFEAISVGADVLNRDMELTHPGITVQ